MNKPFRDDDHPDLEPLWREIRDREIAAGTALGKRVIEEEGFEANWRRAVFWALQHPPAAMKKLGSKDSPWNPEVVHRTREATARTTAEYQRKKVERAEEAELREVARSRAKLARQQATEAARRGAEAHDARLREISARIAKLPGSPSGRAPQMPDPTTGVKCPHGMEKASCAYCGHRRR
jgi:hypothetical protein